MRQLVFGIIAVSLAVFYLATALPAIAATTVEIPDNTIDSAGDNDGGQLLQFTAGGHVLGFGDQSVYLAGLDHALRVEFAGGSPVQPAAEAGGIEQNGAAPLGTVTYNSVWSNIDVVYSAVDGGVAESTYIIHPGSDPADISLRYNVPVEVMPDGGLQFTFESGYMTEDAPAAWQLIDGERLPVTVQFRQQAENQVGFSLGSYNATRTVYIDPAYQWHTFYGSSDSDYGYAIAVDSSDNIYVTGESHDPWGSPLHSHSGGYYDIVVVKLNSSGTYQWHTFYGSSNYDFVFGIAVDPSDSVYVTGYSYATWGTPLDAHAGGGNPDIVVIKLNGSGDLQWHTFHGSSGDDSGKGIAADPSGNVYVTGSSDATWGSPLNSYNGSRDIVVCKLDSSGSLQWHTFYGSSSGDYGYGIAVDSPGNLYVTGYSNSTWGTPLNAFAGWDDIVVIKLNDSGALQWHTFHGSPRADYGRGIAVDPSGDIYVTGESAATWGAPLSAHAGGYFYYPDVLIVKLNGSGALQWNTFYGSSDLDRGHGIAVDSSGNICVIGESYATWGSPINAYAGNDDIVSIKMDSSGAYQWHTFYGSSGDDYGSGIARDSWGNVYVTGHSKAWGSPLNAHAGWDDIVVIKTADPTMPGDADENGEINAGDITMVERMILGWNAETLNADANQDGTVNATDIGVIEYMMLDIWPWNHVHIEAPDNLPYCTHFTATVFITYVEDFGSAGFEVSYNSAVLDLEGVSGGKLMEIDPGVSTDFYTVSIDDWSQPGGAGTLLVNASIDGNPGPDGAGYLAQLHFHVNGSAGQNSPIAFNASQSWLKDNVGDDITATWEDDSVTVAP